MVVKQLRCVFGAVVALVASGCGGGGDGGGGDGGGEAGGVAGTVARVCEPGSVEPLRTDRVAYAGVVRSRATAFRRPGGAVLHRFGRTNANGHVTVLGVFAAVRKRDCSALWYRVQLPLKPNGITGWVRGDQLELVEVRTRILVDLSERMLVLRRNGKPVLRTRVAVGSPATPTPVGRFYVDQRIRALNPRGPYGPGAVGFSAFSEVLTGWVQGGPVAVHGTNQPQRIGMAVSNGCLRVRNEILLRIFRLALPGTPVVVRP